MIALIIIGVLLSFVIFKIWGCLYCKKRVGYGDYTFVKMRRPLWQVILLFTFSLVPIFNIGVVVVCVVFSLPRIIWRLRVSL